MRNLSVLAGFAVMFFIAFHLTILVFAGDGGKCYFYAHMKRMAWDDYSEFVHKGNKACVVPCSIMEYPTGKTYDCNNYKCTFTKEAEEGIGSITGSCPDLSNACVKIGEGTCGEEPPESEPENDGIRGEANWLLLLLFGVVGMAATVVHGGGIAKSIGGFV